MKRTLLFAALFGAIAFSIGPAQAASFSYHGNLQDAGKPAEGNYDLELTLYSAAEGGKIVAGPLMMYKVPVHDGTFSTEADFGPSAQASSGSWLAVKVRSAGNGAFAALSARAPLGANAIATNSSCPGSWSLDGNAGNIAGSYLGTADAQPLTLDVYGERAFQLTEVGAIGSYHCVNVIGGVYTNSINGMCGTIAGGGSIDSGDFSNKVTSDYGSILGGESNSADFYASELGGHNNVASGVGSTVLGGFGNQAGGYTSLAAGHNAHVRNAAEAGVVNGDVGTFVWADSAVAGFSSTGANQFDIRATGGMALNGVPKNSDIELSIYPGASTVYNYSSVFMGNKGDTGGGGGMLISVGDESSTTSNDAAFYIDQFDGTHQTRKLILNTDGLSINGSNTVDTTSHPALSVVAGPSEIISHGVLVDFFPLGGSPPANNGYTGIYSTAFPDTGFGTRVEMDFLLTAKDSTQHVPLYLYTTTVAGNTTDAAIISGNLIVSGTASKPGGGSWSVSSDRRIKQDIAPIHDALDTVMKLRPVNFHYTPEYRAKEGDLPDKSYAGFIAQEYAEVFPADVVSTRDHVPGAPDSDPPILALDPNSALINTVAAVQELAVENTALHKQIDELAARLNKLEGKRGE